MVCESTGEIWTINPATPCLNPCFNGICSASFDKKLSNSIIGSLNPCFNGIWSAREYRPAALELFLIVLILVLMEYGLRVGGQTAVRGTVLDRLNPCFNGIWSARSLSETKGNNNKQSLNPCFNGIWSASPPSKH